MEREKGVAMYFWTLLAGASGLCIVGEITGACVLATGAAILGGINLMARDYFDDI